MYAVIIIGGGFAGLAAATQLGRARRKVLVLDTGKPRNRFAAHSHGFLSRDGAAPGELLAEARRQLDTYKTIERRTAEAISASAVDDGFSLELASGEQLTARRLILAHGVTDSVDTIPGMAACWGKSALHCPYCHGYEVADRPLGLLLREGDILHLARFFSEWTNDLTLFANGTPVDPTVQAALADMRVKLVEEAVVRFDHDDGMLNSVVTTAEPVPLAAIFVHAPISFSTNLGVELGCETKAGAVGDFFVVDHTQQTSIPGVYAAGDAARPMHNISFAVADGAGAGAFAHQSLLATSTVPGK
jgi:thioredoxin reductase